MSDDFIGLQIKKTNRNLVAIGAALLAVVGVTVAVQWRQVYNYINGPFPIQTSELAGIVNPDQPKKYFVKVQGEKTFATGMREVDGDNKKNVRAVVVGLEMGDRILLVKTPVNNHQLEFKGALVAMPSALQTGVVAAYEQKYPDIKGSFFPFLLDATEFRNTDSMLVAAFGVVLGGLGLYLAGLGLARMMQPEQHPLFAKLQRYGLVQDVRMRIDSEIRGEGGGQKFGTLHITSNWLIDAAAYRTTVLAGRDVVWAFQKITKHYHNGIPTGKTFSAIIRDAKGQSVEVSGKKDSVPKLLEAMKLRMPWIFVGYTKELDALWRKEKPKFFQLMEQRRTAPAMARR